MVPHKPSYQSLTNMHMQLNLNVTVRGAVAEAPGGASFQPVCLVEVSSGVFTGLVETELFLLFQRCGGTSERAPH